MNPFFEEIYELRINVGFQGVKSMAVFFVRSLLLCIPLLILWAVGFSMLRSDRGESAPAELLVVFKSPGTPPEKIFAMLKGGAAERFAIPGMPAATVAWLTEKYGLPQGVEFIPAGERTESTFEDALLAGRVIQGERVRKVLLVVADYHVARSRLLLWAETLGTDCRVRVVGIPSGLAPRQKAGLWYNEAMKFPGSFFEYLHYRATGRLLTENHPLDAFFAKLRGWLLLPV